jgi:hypothetical protein
MVQVHVQGFMVNSKDEGYIVLLPGFQKGRDINNTRKNLKNGQCQLFELQNLGYTLDLRVSHFSLHHTRS